MEWKLTPEDLSQELIRHFAKKLELDIPNENLSRYDIHDLVEQMQIELRVSDDANSIGTLRVSKKQRILQQFESQRAEEVEGERTVQWKHHIMRHYWFFPYGNALLCLTSGDTCQVKDFIDGMDLGIEYQKAWEKRIFWKEPGELRCTDYGGFIISTEGRDHLTELGVPFFPNTELPVSPPSYDVADKIHFDENENDFEKLFKSVLENYPLIGVEVVPYKRAYRVNMMFHRAVYELAFGSQYKMTPKQVLENANVQHWGLPNNRYEFQLHPSSLNSYLEKGAQLND